MQRIPAVGGVSSDSKNVLPAEGRPGHRLLFDDFSAFIGAAHFADAMGEFELSAVFTSHHAWHFQLEMGTALVAAGFGNFSKRDCHRFHLLERVANGLLLEKILKTEPARILRVPDAAASLLVAVGAAFRTKTETVVPA